jgi:hypothetical protein
LTGRDSWQGTAKDLLAELENRADERTRKRKDWPSTPRKLSGDLRRLAPNLRRGTALEVRFDRDPGKARRRLVCLDWMGKRPSEPSDTVRNGPVQTDGRTVADSSDGISLSQSGPFGGVAAGSPIDPDEEVVEWTA